MRKLLSVIALVILGGCAKPEVAEPAVKPEAPLYIIVKPVFGMPNSMEGTLVAGATYLCESVPMEQIVVGDVIVFKWGAKLVVHKVYAIGYFDGSRYFLTWGTNNLKPDLNPDGSRHITTETEYVGRVKLDKTSV